MMKCPTLVCLLLSGWLITIAAAEDTPADAELAKRVADVIARHCLRCHDDNVRKGGLSLTTAASAVQGGDSGPAVQAGSADESLIVQMIEGDEPEMPKEGDRLADGDVELIRHWIDRGASWPDGLQVTEPQVTDLDWWSFRPLSEPRVPTLDGQNRRWARNPIDAFICQKLSEHQLVPSPEADRRTLIRRLYFDLIGLPPAYEQIQAFVADDDSAAYENLVDRLLASPHYGERWARHWLDVVHYGDTHGYDKDQPRPNAWPYRDYVIRSFNLDKPFARFVREQIAGDVLWPDTADGIEATGFIGAGPWDLIGHAEVPEEKLDGQVARNLDRDDMVTSTMNTFLGLTIQCARCHNHKFDPISQEQYYSLQAVFAALDRADRQYDVDPAIAARRRELTGQQQSLHERKNALDKRIYQLVGDELRQLDDQIAKLSDSESSESLAELKEARRDLLARHLDEKTRSELSSIDRSLAQNQKRLADLPPMKTAYVGTVHHGSGAFRGRGHVGGKPRDIHILVRGDVKKRGALVGPGTVPIIEGIDWRFSLPADHREGDRRVALADWIVRPDNPMTWRCIVNRIWQYHFGQGIVATPNDFGHMGQQPSHPELLDWLATRFRDSGQSIKDLHRLIVTSSTYRQTSALNERFAIIDADNRYLWRMNRRAAEAEVIRDSVLAVSGKLNLSMYGPGFRDFLLEKPEHSPHYEYHKHDPDDTRCHRRSIYRFLVRSQQQPFMQTLDCADPSQSVARRDTTITAVQALTMLNNKFMVRMAEHFADRLRRESSDLKTQIQNSYRWSFGRDPQQAELDEMMAYTVQFGLENMCRLMFNLNEFAFVD
jgi:hypothetical protein